MPDYVALAALATRLIDGAGRSVSAVQLQRDPTDPLKPWRSATAPRDPAEATVGPVKAAFVDPESATRTGIVSANTDWVKRSEQIALIAAEGIADLSEYDELDDGGSRWRIEGCQTLKPGDVALLYVLGVKR